MSEEHCIRWLRFTKEATTEISQLVRPQLQPQSRARTALPVAVKVTMVLNFCSSGSFQASAGDMCNISQYGSALMHNGGHILTVPDEEQGAIDCVHIALCAPRVNSAVFANRKGFHSLSMQLACDHAHRIMEVDTCYPGSSYDAFIMWQSIMPAIFHLAQQVKGWLLGDKGYPLKPWLVTPVMNPRTRAQQAYNESQAATGNIVEHTLIAQIKTTTKCKFKVTIIN
ncbi:putative nuclease HARBI1 [Heptranchias perlo]|uniref:putative nuclease HARBI1 n=1 Tax=Heptranchias perlo TaxID=212740 RepID=UPI00355AA445